MHYLAENQKLSQHELIDGFIKIQTELDLINYQLFLSAGTPKAMRLKMKSRCAFSGMAVFLLNNRTKTGNVLCCYANYISSVGNCSRL